MPLYICKPSTEKLPKDSKTRLIRAKTKAGALSFAVKDFYSAEACETEEAFKLAKDGVVIEEGDAK